MEFSQGARLWTEDGHEVGRLDRVVIDPKTMEVTHIIVHSGGLVPEDKVVPVDLASRGEDEGIKLRLPSHQLEQMPNFEETHYVVPSQEELARGLERPPKDLAHAVFWYPPYPGPPITPYVESPYVKETQINIPQGTVAVKEGASVVPADEEALGHVEQVLTRPGTDRVTYFVISKGLLLKERKLVPVEWVAQWGEEQVHLAVGIRTIQKLPDFHAPS